MTRSKSLLLFGMFAFVTLMSACTQAVKETTYTTDTPRFEMLIAADASPFKDGIRERLIENYRDQGTVTQIGISNLKKIEPNDYDVILIMDTCLAWTHFNPSLKAFLDRNTDRHNVVLFITAGDPDWAFSHNGLDAVTAASEIENETLVLTKLMGRIDGILATQP